MRDTRDPLRYALLDRLLGSGLIPDAALRAGSRRGATVRLAREERGGVEAQEERLRALIAHMSDGPIAERTDAANAQHYELPPEFFALFLGPRRKYSGCLWPPGVDTIAGAEDAMLELTCRRAGITDGMQILDLGCGWGALSLWMAERFPGARILGVSNSHGQRRWIEAERDRLGLANLEIRTADVNDLDPGRRFDRIVSVEMFEHMRNWAELLRRMRTWLHDDGLAFVHVFSHRTVAYRFEGTWASSRFFTAGTMPSHDLLERFPRDLVVTDRWAVSGVHYARTLRAWLQRLDAHEAQARQVLEAGRSPREARRLLATWRLFLISTAEIWDHHGGDEWLVSHYLLEPRP